MNKNILNKNTISFAIIQFIVFLFTIKYASRITDYYLLAGIFVVAFQTFLWVGNRLFINSKFHEEKFKVITIIQFAVLFFVSMILFSKIPIENLNVDRWSVITSFWDNFFAGEYVFAAKSHMGNPPGPMPFYFIIALPFYLLDAIDYLSLLGILVFYFIMLHQKIAPKYRTIVLLLIIFSPFYIWEICTRSNLFLNSSLILLGMILFVNIKDYNRFASQLMIGILLGLFLSTRNVFAMCYIMMFLYFIKSKQISWGAMSKICVIIFLTFAFTFIPFVINFQNEFLISNPFIVQSDVLIPSYITISILFFSLFIFWFCKNNIEIFFYSGLILFGTICIHFTYHIITQGFDLAFFGSRGDVSYFIFCIPFFYYFLLHSNKK